ncbi:MAG: hypothetical protein QOE54_4793 [Streptosporangiaceae bacterium]|jgi:hypothetical protein|nr:hypothetical protein [Streptosporangiaceae bacterium]MDX6432427.1 hypothetical protein [Streptosporangiaceae bacterium]
MRKHGLVLSLAAGAVLLTGCGGGGSSTAAPQSVAPTDSATQTGTTTPQSTAKPRKTGKAAPVKTGPTVGPGAKCGAATVVSGHTTCAHVAKVFTIYATKKTPKGTAAFSGWTCHSKTTAPKSVTCSRSGVVIRSAA